MLSRSVCGELPSAVCCAAGMCCSPGRFYEATISAIENSPETAARFLEPKFVQERTRSARKPPPGGSEAADTSLTRGLAMAAEAPRSLRFRRASRLKTGRDFRQVRQEGERRVQGCLIANWRKLSGPVATSRLGVITSRRLGNAVIRARARRLLREAFRLHQHELALPIELVLVARNSIVGKDTGAVVSDFLTTLRKAGLLKIGTKKSTA